MSGQEQVTSQPQHAGQTPSFPLQGGAQWNQALGRVSGFSTRFEHSGRSPITVWSFRLERVNQAGRPMSRVPVEMRGRQMLGSINNGDVVEIEQRWRPGRVLLARRAKNLTTGSYV